LKSTHFYIKKIKSYLPRVLAADRLAARREISRLVHRNKKSTAQYNFKQRFDRLQKRLAASEQKRNIRLKNLPDLRFNEELPIFAKKDEIIDAIKRHRVIVVAGETGSGKTTQLPKFCLAAGRGVDGIVGCTQPRRLAATTVARRIAEELDRRYFRLDVPYKIKIGVTGCANNCGKARESDIGVMGMRIPVWSEEQCIGCGACVKMCPVHAITCTDERYQRDESVCIGCSVCSVLCPKSAWGPESTGYTLLIGGTLGKKPRLGIPLRTNIQTEDELFDLVEKTLRFYKKHGQPKERLGHVMSRMGENQAIRTILATDE